MDESIIDEPVDLAELYEDQFNPVDGSEEKYWVKDAARRLILFCTHCATMAISNDPTLAENATRTYHQGHQVVRL